MRLFTTIFSLLSLLGLAACGDKSDFEKKAEKDAAARRIVNTGGK